VTARILAYSNSNHIGQVCLKDMASWNELAFIYIHSVLSSLHNQIKLNIKTMDCSTTPHSNKLVQITSKRGLLGKNPDVSSILDNHWFAKVRQ